MEDISKLLSDLADYIGRHQLPSGAIPWYDEGITESLGSRGMRHRS